MYNYTGDLPVGTIVDYFGNPVTVIGVENVNNLPIELRDHQYGILPQYIYYISEDEGVKSISEINKGKLYENINTLTRSTTAKRMYTKVGSVWAYQRSKMVRRLIDLIADDASKVIPNDKGLLFPYVEVRDDDAIKDYTSPNYTNIYNNFKTQLIAKCKSRGILYFNEDAPNIGDLPKYLTYNEYRSLNEIFRELNNDGRTRIDAGGDTRINYLGSPHYYKSASNTPGKYRRRLFSTLLEMVYNRDNFTNLEYRNEWYGKASSDPYWYIKHKYNLEYTWLNPNSAISIPGMVTNFAKDTQASKYYDQRLAIWGAVSDPGKYSRDKNHMLNMPMVYNFSDGIHGTNANGSLILRTNDGTGFNVSEIDKRKGFSYYIKNEKVYNRIDPAQPLVSEEVYVRSGAHSRLENILLTGESQTNYFTKTFVDTNKAVLVRTYTKTKDTPYKDVPHLAFVNLDSDYGYVGLADPIPTRNSLNFFKGTTGNPVTMGVNSFKGGLPDTILKEEYDLIPDRLYVVVHSDVNRLTENRNVEVGPMPTNTSSTSIYLIQKEVLYDIDTPLINIETYNNWVGKNNEEFNKHNQSYSGYQDVVDTYIRSQFGNNTKNRSRNFNNMNVDTALNTHRYALYSAEFPANDPRFSDLLNKNTGVDIIIDTNDIWGNISGTGKPIRDNLIFPNTVNQNVFRTMREYQVVLFLNQDGSRCRFGIFDKFRSYGLAKNKYTDGNINRKAVGQYVDSLVLQRNVEFTANPIDLLPLFVNHAGDTEDISMRSFAKLVTNKGYDKDLDVVNGRFVPIKVNGRTAYHEAFMQRHLPDRVKLGDFDYEGPIALIGPNDSTQESIDTYTLADLDNPGMSLDYDNLTNDMEVLTDVPYKAHVIVDNIYALYNTPEEKLTKHNLVYSLDNIESLLLIESLDTLAANYNGYDGDIMNVYNGQLSLGSRELIKGVAPATNISQLPDYLYKFQIERDIERRENIFFYKGGHIYVSTVEQLYGGRFRPIRGDIGRPMTADEFAGVDTTSMPANQIPTFEPDTATAVAAPGMPWRYSKISFDSEKINKIRFTLTRYCWIIISKADNTFDISVLLNMLNDSHGYSRTYKHTVTRIPRLFNNATNRPIRSLVPRTEVNPLITGEYDSRLPEIGDEIELENTGTEFIIRYRKRNTEEWQMYKHLYAANHRDALVRGKFNRVGIGINYTNPEGSNTNKIAENIKVVVTQPEIPFVTTEEGTGSVRPNPDNVTT